MQSHSMSIKGVCNFHSLHKINSLFILRLLDSLNEFDNVWYVTLIFIMFFNMLVVVTSLAAVKC